jgi:hypothetical protein
LIGIEQIDLFVDCLYERSIEGRAEVVGVEYQQVFVDGETFLGRANDDRNNSSLEVLAVARKDPYMNCRYD